MCELFGVTASKEIQLNTLLETFFSHGVKHPHGWGMAFFDGNTVHVEKQPVASNKSAYLREYLERDIKTDKMIAHIRLATKGYLEYENCHPFVREDNSGRIWTLAHNGTIFEGDILNPFFYVQEGQTDSERILYFIIEQINKRQEEAGRPLAGQERFRLLDEIVCGLADENKLNLLIYDGEYLYVHTNCRNSLHICRRDGGAIFSTVPLDKEEWELVPLNTLFAWQNGQQVAQGTNHGCEYTEDAEKMKLLFLDYSAL